MCCNLSTDDNMVLSKLPVWCCASLADRTEHNLCIVMVTCSNPKWCDTQIVVCNFVLEPKQPSAPNLALLFADRGRAWCYTRPENFWRILPNVASLSHLFRYYIRYRDRSSYTRYAKAESWRTRPKFSSSCPPVDPWKIPSLKLGLTWYNAWL